MKVSLVFAKKALPALLFFVGLTGCVSAETVSGNGYNVQQVVTPMQGGVSGNGYTVQQAGQVIGGDISGGGSIIQSVFGFFSTPTTPTPPPVSYGGGGSGWYYVIPTATTSTTTITATSTPVRPDTILTTNGSTCSSRIALSGPVDVKLVNNKEDVKKLETFLNTYEGEKLKVDGIYGKADIAAVKRWQQKYRKQILTPMKLRNPTGTVYTASMRQIERQTTARCGQAIIVHTCPFFTTYTKYGDTGAEVKKVQQFLNIVQGEKLPVSGKYGPATRAAVLRFQRMYRKDIRSVVTLSFMSGNWNVSTRTKANEVIGCDKLK